MLELRPVMETDLPILFEQQLDPDANWMAAFTSKDPTDRAAFMAKWQRILGDPTVVTRTVLYNGEVAGSVLCYEDEGQKDIGYWIGRAFWGRGIATGALRAFLAELAVRPLYARVATDNRASLRVLQKCGFTVVGEERGFANARGCEIAEYVTRLG